MSAHEQVADLREGDVVTIRWIVHPDVIVTGPLRPRGGGQWVGPVPVIGPSGELSEGIGITVVSRAPRLYVNHPRTEPVPGDVAGPAEPGANDGQTWHFLDGIGSQWFDKRGYGLTRDDLPARLRLLVDGETGQVVP